jgi:hypothetical protein
MNIKDMIKSKIENDILKFDEFGVDNSWSINKNNIHKYLIEPRYEEYLSWDMKNKIMLWTVFEGDDVSYKIVYSEENECFGMTMITDNNEKIFLGIYGSFVETFCAL